MKPPIFIAELGSCHNGSWCRMQELIRAAADAGFDAVKPQFFRIRGLFSPEALERDPTLLEREKWEIPDQWINPIRDECDANRVDFYATIFPGREIEQIMNVIDVAKISSYELMCHDFIREATKYLTMVILSTGMATLDEIQTAIGAGKGEWIELMHCVSTYPASSEECNLAAIETIRTATWRPVGWSDHTRNPDVVYRAAVVWRAHMIELHFDLYDDVAGWDSGAHTWGPGLAKRAIRSIRDVFEGGGIVDGDGRKRPSRSEKSERDWRADPVDGMRPLRVFRRS